MSAAVAVELDDHVRKQMVIMSLMDFYREHDPRQIPMVENTFYEHSKDIVGLFDRLLKRYPRVPRDRFDDVLATLRGLDSSSQQQRDTMSAQSTMRSKRAQVQELLREGASLLAAPVPAEFAADRASQSDRGGDDDTQSRTSYGDSAYGGGYGGNNFGGAGTDTDSDMADASGAHRDDLQVLKQLIEDNRKLADDVAIAEQQVLQKRFEVKYYKVVAPHTADIRSSQDGLSSSVATGGDRGASSKPSVAMLMIVADRDRQFEIPCTHAEASYIRQGPLDAPWSLDEEEHCQVQFQPLEGPNHRGKKFAALGGAAGAREDNVTPDTDEPPAKVMRTVLAMAMRVWSRRRPHTITERLSSGEVSTHTSSILWWQWPSPCEGQRGVAPESLLHISSEHAGDGVDRALRRVDQELNAPVEAERRLHPLHEEVCHLLTSTPSYRGVAQHAVSHAHMSSASSKDDVSPNKQDTFWKYFVYQYGALSRSGPTTTQPTDVLSN